MSWWTVTPSWWTVTPSQRTSEGPDLTREEWEAVYDSMGESEIEPPDAPGTTAFAKIEAFLASGGGTG